MTGIDVLLLLAETGAEGASGPSWLRYIYGEIMAARGSGIPVEGLCIYPITDYPGWNDERHCECGLIRISSNWETRQLCPTMLKEV